MQVPCFVVTFLYVYLSDLRILALLRGAVKAHVRCYLRCIIPNALLVLVLGSSLEKECRFARPLTTPSLSVFICGSSPIPIFAKIRLAEIDAPESKQAHGQRSSAVLTASSPSNLQVSGFPILHPFPHDPPPAPTASASGVPPPQSPHGLSGSANGPQISPYSLAILQMKNVETRPL